MSKKEQKKQFAPELYDVVRAPVVTEKSTLLGEQNKYVFTVAPSATKTQVRQAVEKIFGTSVEKVNMICTKGKTKRFRGVKGRRSDVKKAIVTLAEGKSIDMAAGV
jgi:large subunit ribosomal protein L23